jgi:hypothetical protein
MVENVSTSPAPEPVVLIAGQPDGATAGGGEQREPSPSRVPEPLSFDAVVIEKLRVLVVAGISVGVVVVGLGSRAVVSG